MIWLSALGYAVTNAGITNFNPLIISGYGFGKTKTLLMATPQAAVAMVASATLTAVSMYMPKVRCFFWIFGATMGLIGAVMVHTLHSSDTRNASLAGVYLMGFYNVPWVFTLSLSSSNTGGATKKSFMGITCAVMYGKSLILAPSLFPVLTFRKPSATSLDHSSSSLRNHRRTHWALAQCLSHSRSWQLLVWCTMASVSTRISVEIGFTVQRRVKQLSDCRRREMT